MPSCVTKTIDFSWKVNLRLNFRGTTSHSIKIKIDGICFPRKSYMNTSSEYKWTSTRWQTSNLNCFCRQSAAVLTFSGYKNVFEVRFGYVLDVSVFVCWVDRANGERKERERRANETTMGTYAHGLYLWRKRAWYFILSSRAHTRPRLSFFSFSLSFSLRSHVKYELEQNEKSALFNSCTSCKTIRFAQLLVKHFTIWMYKISFEKFSSRNDNL